MTVSSKWPWLQKLITHTQYFLEIANFHSWLRRLDAILLVGVRVEEHYELPLGLNELLLLTN